MRTGELASIGDIASLGRTAQPKNQPDERVISAFTATASPVSAAIVCFLAHDGRKIFNCN
jgi:hypothetical protein